ncbi:putative E3 ubiquitin-protein ligase [Besnoitia besnoiti]|uniref:HECT-type E3 ubiquitin transferase n=1 Tax=Besnoitia besnoiti TaxID=94643 RepID=A0A2A9M5D8_BESBE|nr:putative E3 ubiquitin-protein ligase [Besnoitia besnoiti]PFH32424.1 putative E3 ubiquitin-protein ligase [Besnoitia besnoiti]
MASSSQADSPSLARLGSQLNWGLYEQFLVIELNPTEGAISALTLDAKLRASTSGSPSSSPGAARALADRLCAFPPEKLSAAETDAVEQSLPSLRDCSPYQKLRAAREFLLTEAQYKDSALAEGDKEKWKPIIDFFGSLYALSSNFLLAPARKRRGARRAVQVPQAPFAHGSAEAKRENGRDSPAPSSQQSPVPSPAPSPFSALSAGPPAGSPASASPRRAEESDTRTKSENALARVEKVKRKTDVDLKRVREFYAALQTAGRAAASKGYEPLGEILEKIRVFCDDLQNRVDKLIYPCQLRFALVLLECPFFEEDGNLAALVELARTISMLSDAAKDTLVNWYEKIPAAYVRAHVVNVQQLITLRLLSFPDINTLRDAFAAPLRHALHTLHIFYVATNRRQERQRRALCAAAVSPAEVEPTALAVAEVRGALDGGGDEERLTSTGSAGGGKKRAPRVEYPTEKRTRKDGSGEAEEGDAEREESDAEDGDGESDAEDGDEAPLGYEEFQNDAVNTQQQLLRYEFAQWLDWRGRAASASASPTSLSPEEARHDRDAQSGEELQDDRRRPRESEDEPSEEKEASKPEDARAEAVVATPASADSAAAGAASSASSSQRSGKTTSSTALSLHLYLPSRETYAQETDFALLQHPFVVDAANKSAALKRQAAVQQLNQARRVEMDAIFSLFTGQGAVDSNPFLDIVVRREHIVQDTLLEIDRRSRIPNALKKALRVRFAGEDGVDEGGVKKEFFQLLVQELFSPGYDMFLHCEDSHLCWFNPVSTEEMSNFRLIGVIFGLAIYNGVLLGISFPSVIFRKLLGWTASSLEDLEELHPSIARSLRVLLGASAETVEAMALTFSVELDCYGDRVELPLGEHAVTDEVTIENREEYVRLYVDHVLNKSIEAQYRAFHQGFHSCVHEATISLFRPEELQRVILGSEEELDFEKLRTATSYQDGYTAESQTVQDFWAVADALDSAQKKKLLMFVTGSDRVPIKGLSSLRFVIGRNGSDTDRLPTAHTCFNYLLLPDYQNREKLQKLLQIAIENCQGFGLR